MTLSQSRITDLPLRWNTANTFGAIPSFAEQQSMLAIFNRSRLNPGLGEALGYAETLYLQDMMLLEESFVRGALNEIAPLVNNVPQQADAFVAWFENLKESGPGQGDPLFPWLAEQASYEDVRLFLTQEIGGEAGFEDLVALTQVKMPPRAKLEMARNYWDEMGRGDCKGMHGPMLSRLARHFGIEADISDTLPESLALANMMMALAFNRRYAFHAIGALGAIEMTAPGRAAYIVRALERLGVPKKESHYFSLHAVLDVKHSQAWNEEVLKSLVAEDPRRARSLAEGALLRLKRGEHCFRRYRRELGLCRI